MKKNLTRNIFLVVLVLAVATFAIAIGLQNKQEPKTEPSGTPTVQQVTVPENLTEDAGIVVVDGKPESVVTAPEPKRVGVFLFDYDCFFCQKFEAADDYKALVDANKAGDISVVFYPLAFLDKEGEDYSSKTASASFTVADVEPDKWLVFHDSLMAASAGRDKSVKPEDIIAKVAKDVGVKDATLEAINKFEYLDLAKYAAQTAFEYIEGTPAVFIDNTPVPILQNETAIRDALNGGKK